MYRQTLEERFQARVFAMAKRGDLQRLAEAVSKTYPTLMRELNPFDTRSKLSIGTACAIMRATGDAELLRIIAEEAGFAGLITALNSSENEGLRAQPLHGG